MSGKGKVFWVLCTPDGEHYALGMNKRWLKEGDVSLWVDSDTWHYLFGIKLKPGEGPIKCRIERVG